jgi:hypothetical protein
MKLPQGQVLYNNSEALGVPVPEDMAQALLNPTSTWLMEWPMYILWVMLSLWFCYQWRRDGKIGFAALLFWGMTTAFWQEFYADWAAYLVYTPGFELMPWDSPYTSPNKPWFMLATYGLYFLPIFQLMLWATGQVRKALPAIPLLVASLMVSAPLFYLFNFAFEGFAVASGWWIYPKSPGPHFTMASGTDYPLIFPVLPFVVYGAIACAVLCLKNDQGVHRLEAFDSVQNMSAGWKKEVARLLVWSVMMNLLYWFTFTLPLMLMRIVGIV